jgi:hypothetical protein
MQRAMSRQVSVLPVSRSERTARFLVCNSEAEIEVQGWLSEGSDFGQVLSRLNGAEEV